MSERNNERVEAFRQTTAATSRAIAKRESLEVQFGPGTPIMQDGTLHVPKPGADLAYETVSRVRGEADAMALRLRLIKPRCIRRCPPRSAPRAKSLTCSNNRVVRPSALAA